MSYVSFVNNGDEGNPNDINLEVGNSKHNQINLTTLERSCWSRHRKAISVGIVSAFIVTVIIIGVLVVCLHTKNPPIIQKCELKFSRLNTNPVQSNYGPRSVAVGDFNDDTWLDMVIANSIADNIVIYLGHGNGSFLELSSYSTGSYSAPNMVVVGDFNNDFRLDIAVTNFGTNNIGIFFGLENASFANQIELSTAASRPVAIYLADFNDDTFLDIVTTNDGTHSISVFYGYGNGKFSNSNMYSTGFDSEPSSLAAGDFNNDNHLDLVIADYGTDNVELLLGNSRSTLTDQVIFSTGSGSHPISIAVGHLSDDGLLDIAVANFGNNQIGVLLNNGNGSFIYRTIYSLESASPYSIGVADFNQDKRMDLVFTNKGADNIGILLGYGNGTFGSAKMYSTGSLSSIAFATGDLNKDNRLDLIVVSNDTGRIDILFGYSEGSSNQMTYSAGTSPFSVAINGFNNDGKLNFTVANYNTNNLNTFVQTC